MEFTKQERRVVRSVVKSLCRSPMNQDVDDLEQAAYIALWRFREKRGEVPTGGLLNVVVKRAAIDEWRRLRGSAREYSAALRNVRNPATMPHGVEELVHHHDSYFPDVVELYGIKDERLALIALRLSNGATKQECAEELGLHPSRISQILPRLRAEMVEACNPV